MENDGREWPLERFVTGLDELRTVLGADTGPALEKVRHEILKGMAQRDRGDRDGTLACIANAMAMLAGLGDRLGGAEGAMMRAVTAAFIGGMARADQDAIERNLSVIQGNAGTPRKRD